MIFKKQIEVTDHLWVFRQKITSLKARWEVKEVFDNKWNKLWYVIVKDFIKYLVS